MDLKTRMEVLPCGKCEDMIGCDNCIFVKEAKELYKQIRADTLNEFVTRFEEEYSRMAVHLGEFRKYQYEMHRLAEEMIKE